jgi:Phosphotransferase system, HPr-related proteins
MKTTNIRLSSIQDVRSFVEIMAKYDAEVDLICGRYIVDGKSIMGIFSLDLLNPIKLVAQNASDEEIAKLFEEIKPFEVK